MDQEKLRETVIKALTTGDPVADLEEDGCYINPQVYSDDERLIKDCNQMNELTDVVITYDFDDRKETVDRNVIRTFLSRDGNEDLVLDKEKIADYVKTLGEKYDTVGTERTFETYDNRQITVSGGNYGWVIDQRKKETEILYQEIISKNTQVRKPEYKQSGMSRNTNDIGYTYVEINLPAQRLVVYQDGIPVADTGISAGSGTETGIYTVGEMQSPAEVNGGNVNFWIPYKENSGIVDNPNLTQSDVGFWEEGFSAVSDFGSGESSTDGGIWTDNSGYIEIPGDMASEVYQNVRSGMPVVIYK